MEDFQKYGDSVVFYHQGKNVGGKQDNTSNVSKNNENSCGILSAQGFIDTGVYFQKQNNNVEFENSGIPSKIDLLNFQDGVFRITPKLNFDFHKEHKKTMKYYKKLIRALNNSKEGEQENLKKLKEDLESKLAKLTERMKKEKKLNKNLIKDIEDKFITYGTEVQLMHADSYSFIKARSDCANTEKIGYNCDVSLWYSSGMVFKILPKFKSRQEGDVIQVRDHVIQQNVKHEAYQDIAYELKANNDYVYGENTNPFLATYNIIDPRTERNYIFLSQEMDCTFQLILFRKISCQTEGNLVGGDQVKIKHTEIQSDQTSDIKYYQDTPEVYLRKYCGEYKEEKTSLFSYWILEHNRFQNCGSIFDHDDKEFDLNKYQISVRLRHFLSGKLITQTGDNHQCVLEKQFVSSKDNNFILEPVVKNSNQLLDKHTYYITDNKKQFLKYDKSKSSNKESLHDKQRILERDNGKFLLQLQRDDDKYQFSYLEEKDLNEFRYPSIFTNEFSSEDAYIQEKVADAEKSELLIVRSTMSQFRYFASIFKNNKDNASKNQNSNENGKDLSHCTELYVQVLAAQEKIIDFLFENDVSPDNGVNIYEIEDDPLPYKQKILKDIGFIDVLIDIIYYPLRNGFSDQEYLDESNPFMEVMSLTYTALRYTIKEFRPNELYASQWLNLIMDQALQTRDHNDIKAGQTLTELIDNNQRILENRIDVSTINRFIQFLVQYDKDSKFQDILRAICICDEKPILENQKIISDRMLVPNDEQANVQNELLFDQKKSYNRGSHDYLVKMSIPGYSEKDNVKLFDLYNISKEKDKSKTYKYFIVMVKLLSDLCKDRNYIAIDILQKKFDYDVIFGIMKHEDDNQQGLSGIRESFTILLEHLWIDVSPFQIIELPYCIKIWDQLEDDNLFMEISHNQAKYSPLKEYLLNYQEVLQDHNQNSDEDKYSQDLAIFNLIFKMMKQSFFTTIQELNRIINSLRLYLKTKGKPEVNDLRFGSTMQKDYTSFGTLVPKSKMNDNEDGNQIDLELENDKEVIECKKRVCQILYFAIEIQNELRICEFFKKLKYFIKNEKQFFDTRMQFLDDPTNKTGDSDSDKKCDEEINDKMEALLDDLMKEESKLDIDKSDEFIEVLYDLTLYKDLSLKTSAFDLLHSLYSQNSNLGNTLFDIQIIHDQFSFDKYTKATQSSFILNTVGDTMEKWYKEANTPEMSHQAILFNMLYKNLIKSAKNVALGTDGDLKEIEAIVLSPDSLNDELARETKPQTWETFKKMKNKPKQINILIDPDFLEIPQVKGLTDIHQFLIECEEEKLDQFEQNLYRNSRVLVGQIKMLQFDAQMEDSRDYENMRLMIKKIYRIVTKACKDNQKNKIMLNEYQEEVVLEHFSQSHEVDKETGSTTKYDVNSYQLLREMAINNKVILLDDKMVSQVTQKICGAINDMPNTDIRKSFQLTILSSMMKYNNYTLKNNQNTILTHMISKNYHNIMLMIDSQEFLEDIYTIAATKYLESCMITYESKNIIILPHGLCYAIAYIDQLTVCTEDKNAFSENICQNLVNLERLHKLLTYKDFNIVLKYSLTMFFYHVYLDTEREIPFHILEIFISILKCLEQDYQYYALKQYKDHDDDYVIKENYYILSFDTYDTYLTWVEKYILILIDSFTNIIRRNINLIPESEAAKDYNKFLVSVVEINAEAIEKFSNLEIRSRFKNLLSEIITNSNCKKAEELILDKYRPLLDNTKYKSNENKLRVNLEGSRRLSIHDFGGESQKLFDKISYMIETYFKSEIFENRCENEFGNIVAKLESLKPTNAKNSSVGFERFVSSQQKYQRPGNQFCNDKMTIIGLKILRTFIESTCEAGDNDEEKTKKCIVDWEPEDLENCRQLFKKKQNLLVRLGTVPLVGEILKTSDDQQVLEETLQLSIALLFGGNQGTQDAFYQYFCDDKESVFLTKLQDLLKNTFEVVRKVNREKNSESMKAFYRREDNNKLSKTKKAIGGKVGIANQADGYNQEKQNLQEDQDQESEGDSKSTNIVKTEVEDVDRNYRNCIFIFKCQQQLCEGHNEEQQNYLREQNKGSSNVYSTKGINFIQTSAALWGSYIKFVNPHCHELGNIMLDFLTEAIQGPRELNQDELFRNKIIEFSKDFMNDFNSRRDYQARGFDDDNKHIQDELVLSNIKMLNSLLEANDKEYIIDCMSSNIDFEYLIRILVDIFKSLFADYDEIKNNSANEVEAFNKKIRNQTTFDAPFQEAFNIFFFIETMVNNEKSDYRNKIKELTGLKKTAYEVFKANSAHIEIDFHQGLHKVYFMIQPACHYLDDNKKKSFQDTSKRETNNEKITFLMLEAPKYFDIMDHMSRLMKKCAIANQDTFKYVRDICLILALTLNIFIFVLYEVDVTNGVGIIVTRWSGTQTALYILGGLHILFSVLMIILWFVVDGKIDLMNQWRDKILFYKKNLNKSNESSSGNFFSNKKKEYEMKVFELLNRPIIELKKEDKIEIIKLYNDKNGYKYSQPTLEYFSYTIYFILYGSGFQIYVIYILMSVVALWRDVVILYSLHLLDIIVSLIFIRKNREGLIHLEMLLKLLPITKSS